MDLEFVPVSLGSVRSFNAAPRILNGVRAAKKLFSGTYVHRYLGRGTGMYRSISPLCLHLSTWHSIGAQNVLRPPSPVMHRSRFPIHPSSCFMFIPRHQMDVAHCHLTRSLQTDRNERYVPVRTCELSMSWVAGGAPELESPLSPMEARGAWGGYELRANPIRPA